MTSEPAFRPVDPVLAELLALVAQRASEGRVEIGTTFEITVRPGAASGAAYPPAA